MKLYSSTSSPYARKVRLLILEKGLQQLIAEVVVNPFDNRAELLPINPLGKIPVLVLNDAEVLFDSPLICQYLDELPGYHRLIPQQKKEKFNVLRWQALADGMTDAAYNLVMERRRPVANQSSSSIGTWSAEILGALDEMDARLDGLGDKITLAHLAVGAAVGYVEFRLPELLYESSCPQIASCPKLLNWYEAFKTRPAMLATQPH